MSQLLQSVIDSPISAKLLAAVGVATPTKLERYDSAQKTCFSGNILLGAAANSDLLQAVFVALEDTDANLYSPEHGPGFAHIEALAQTSNCGIKNYQQDTDNNPRFKALVFDASAISNSSELVSLHQFFQQGLKQLETCSRIIVLGRPPQSLTDSKHHTAQRALEGFTRCLSKEVGKKGTTVQLVYVEAGAEAGTVSPIQFLLSSRSSYVSAQVIRVNNPQGTLGNPQWQQPLAGKVALVTGASRGIGEKIARVMTADGALVIGLDIPAAAEPLNALMAEIGGKALPLDICAEETPASIAAFCNEHYQGLDIIVHNAGVTRDKTLRNMPEHFWSMTIDINLGAEERINDYLLQHDVLRNSGRIVCVSSVSGIAGNFGQTNYGASKAGVIGMVESMAPVLQARDITINAVAPGFIETQMTNAIPFLVREVGKRINALGQAGKPEDVANTIAFLASPGSGMVTGNVIRVCGQSMLGA